MNFNIIIITIQESISIPVAYIEAFVMMFIAFLIGYFGAVIYGKMQTKKQTALLNDEISQLKLRLKELQTENDRIPEGNFKKDRMDQEFEQLQLHKRAFSNHVLAETAEVPKPKGINFSNIGHASKEEKDDLQKIIGIGPYTETKLNDLGIYTFTQISKLTEEDIAVVTELIKFFPDRIKNDRWVSKAKNLIYEQSKGSEDDAKKKMMNEKTT